MAGHSKWKNIQHRKGAQDAKRGKVFTKIAIEITVAARLGGGDPADNPRLRTALAKAKASNMPKENWVRAIKKGTGNLEGFSYTEKVYEGYGPGGVAVIVESLTDNINRTVGEIRYIFSRSGGNLGQEGSVNWIFERKGLFLFSKENVKEFDKLFELSIENGADDVEEQEEGYQITCELEKFIGLKQVYDDNKITAELFEMSYLPKNNVALEEGKYESLEKMVALLEDNDDIQNVYHNGVLVS